MVLLERDSRVRQLEERLQVLLLSYTHTRFFFCFFFFFFFL